IYGFARQTFDHSEDLIDVPFFVEAFRHNLRNPVRTSMPTEIMAAPAESNHPNRCCMQRRRPLLPDLLEQAEPEGDRDHVHPVLGFEDALRSVDMKTDCARRDAKARADRVFALAIGQVSDTFTFTGTENRSRRLLAYSVGHHAV